MTVPIEADGLTDGLQRHMRDAIDKGGDKGGAVEFDGGQGGCGGFSHDGLSITGFLPCRPPAKRVADRAGWRTGSRNRHPLAGVPHGPPKRVMLRNKKAAFQREARLVAPRFRAAKPVPLSR
ncbi:hypothetical protein GCM10007935_10060 [Hydrogenophaga electricum]|uniref:Uncharacterized protein n=1 Tax=Hydrogenophaga electricum TaxID=1230953 RepID=A0ABQ6C008_9BURK|nr:hypothetical protein GCM10007935_10060 [Hydrogenophaga electricum]